MEDVQKLSDEIKKQLQKLDTVTLEQIYKDHAKAVEYFKKGFNNISVEELNKRSIEDSASEMQAVAKMELDQRQTTK